jgi:hypothetical protein
LSYSRKMIRLFLLCWTIFSILFCSGQGISNLWLLGYANPLHLPYGGTTIDFSSGQFLDHTENRHINFSCANAVMADAEGNLLFATNGIHIINATNDTMLNGSGLSPCLYSTVYNNYGLLIPQADIIIPFPSDSNKYYLFHGSAEDYGISDCSLHLYYSIIDMTHDNGLGEVINKNVPLLNDSLVVGRITACRHANGRDWWLTCHKYHSNRYYKFLITPYGIQGPFTQDIGAIREIKLGQNCFSPDGSTFAYYEPIYGDLDIFNFDRCTGDFSPLAHVDINDSAVGGGVAFSPNSKVLYVSSMNYIYQFDLTSSSIATNFDMLAVYDWFYSPNPPLATLFFLSYLAPDGKIYINCSNGSLDLHVINNPDSLGSAANICQHCIHIPTYNFTTIPNYPNYFLGSIPGSSCDSLVGISQSQYYSENIYIYPNPVSNQTFTISFPPKSTSTELTIYNLNGDIVYLNKISPWSNYQKITFPDNMASGMYYAVLRGEKTLSTRFIIN